MSKLTATFATLFLLGTSAAAMASPATTSARTSSRTSWSWNQRTYPQIRDHRDSDYNEYRPAPVAHSWSLVGTVNWVVKDQSMVFPINRARPLSQIKLVSNGGKSRIMGVKINFANGTQQTIALDRYVGNQGTVAIPASPTYTIDVQDHCPVTSIVIDGLNATSSSYSVLAL